MHDNISKISKNVKQLHINAVHRDAFTLKQNANDDDELKKSSLNSKIKQWETFTIKRLFYQQTSHSCIYHEEYQWLNDTIHLHDVLLWIIVNEFHKFKMLLNRNESFKEHHHHM